MTIVNHISNLIGKEFLDRSLIQQRSTQYSQHFVGTSMQSEVVFYNCHHAICCYGSKYLDTYSILRCSPKGFDFKMLLDPFKEEFHLPTIFEFALRIFQRYWSDIQKFCSTFQRRIQLCGAHQDTSWQKHTR